MSEREVDQQLVERAQEPAQRAVAYVTLERPAAGISAGANCSGPEGFGPWVFGILVNRCRTYAARRIRADGVIVTNDDAVGDSISPAASLSCGALVWLGTPSSLSSAVVTGSTAESSRPLS